MKYLILSFLFLLGSCSYSTTAQMEKPFTLGLVQKEIKKGMSQAEVVEVLGSPNILTKDASNNENWVYDKIFSEAKYSASEGGFSLILFGFAKADSSRISSSKNLTVVIKFNEKALVESISYHASKF